MQRTLNISDKTKDEFDALLFKKRKELKTQDDLIKFLMDFYNNGKGGKN